MKKNNPTVVMKSMNEVFEIMKQQIKPKPMRKPKQTLAALLNECDTISEAKALIPIWLENKRAEIEKSEFKDADGIYPDKFILNDIKKTLLKILK